MKMMTIDEFHDMNVSIANDFLKKRKKVSFQITMATDKGLIPMIYATELDDRLFDGIKVLVRNNEAYLLNIMSEAYTLTKSPDAPMPRIRPSRHPDRKESLIVYTFSKTRKLFTMTMFHRTESGEIVFGETSETSDISRMESRFDTLMEALRK